MKIAFYKAFQPRRDSESIFKYIKRLWLDWAVAIMSMGKYSHVELIIDDFWFSISPRSGVFEYRKINYNPDSWDVFDLGMNHRDILNAKKQISKYVDKRYDYIGALTSIMPFCIELDDRIFCSEVCTDILAKTNKYSFLPDGCRLTPSELCTYITGRK